MPTSTNNPPDEHGLSSTEHPDSGGAWCDFYQRFSRWILLGYVLLAPAYLLISAKIMTPGDMSAFLLDVGHWLPQDAHMVADMEKFSTVAGSDRSKVVRISWPGCNEDDPRQTQFRESLAKLTWPDQFSNLDLSGKIFTDVLDVERLYEKLQTAAPVLTKDQIHEQLKNVMIGDSGTTCLIATITSNLPPARAHAIGQIYEAASSVEGLSEDDLRTFGGPVYTTQIDRSGANIATKFTPLSVLISLVCAWFCMRRWPVLTALFLNALLGTCVALVTLYFSNVVMDPVLMLLPGFWMIMLLSGGIHFVNYYFESQQTEFPAESYAGRAAATAFRPAFLATMTTCIGLSSLCTSEVMPVYRFGLQASIGLAFSFVSQFLFLPAFLQMFAISSSPVASENRIWLWYEKFIVGFRYKTALVFLLLIACGTYGFTKLGFSNRLKDQFAAGTRINNDTEWFEQNIGPLIPFEILVRFPKSNLPRPSKCLGYIDSLQKQLQQLPYPVKTLSATAVVPFDAAGGARQAMRRTILDKKLESHRQSLVETGYVIDEPDNELWRISVFTYSAGKESMNDYFAAIERTIDEQKQNHTEVADPVVSYAGLGTRMAVITRKLGGGFLKSSLTSAALISLVVIISLRSFVLGMTAMLPNLFPVLLSFGGFGYFQPTLDIGAIMTASIAMGIAVDDTIHFMYWFRQGISSRLSRVEAIQLAIKKSGRAIASTSLICGLGFCVYFFCDFMPIARFGQLLFLMLGAALVGDLFFLPALLRSLPQALFPVEDGLKSDDDANHNSANVNPVNFEQREAS